MFKRFAPPLLIFTLALIVAVVTALTCGLAFAADPSAAPTAPEALAGFLRDTVFPIVGTAVLGVLSVFINRLGQKFKIEALTQRGNFLERLAYQGITLAEERAAQYVGSKGALTGKQKLDLAVTHVLTAMPKITEPQAQRIVESLLAQIPGVGATGASAYTRGPIGSLALPSAAKAPAPQ
ncbi:hypothetical protein [Geobacter sp.]|uniref:hypothetical protein n=1 Tax=Geobacter sp. TaxID=46610 RepID=UPI002612CC15|nr:hypothetical protein [Geobacter sp.]